MDLLEQQFDNCFNPSAGLMGVRTMSSSNSILLADRSFNPSAGLMGVRTRLELHQRADRIVSIPRLG